ncbi:MAG TPA: TetR/AcrR family transcriptional regulator [Nocardioidaceae bacterium]|nr:TetR/AcrR family transcriptional regulator [Nocardioidaceae bacterium]
MTRKRKGVELRRDEILASTAEVVDRIGLAATRVTDVAEALSVSPALIFYHFGTKDELIVEAFAYAVERDLSRLDRAVAKGTDPVDQLRRALKSYGPTGPATGWRIWIDAWALAQREPEIRKVLRRMDDRWCDVLRGIVEAGVAGGVFTCPDPNATVSRVSAMLDGLSVATLVYRTVSRAQLRDWITDLVAQEIGLDGRSLR